MQKLQVQEAINQCKKGEWKNGRDFKGNTGKTAANII